MRWRGEATARCVGRLLEEEGRRVTRNTEEVAHEARYYRDVCRGQVIQLNLNSNLGGAEMDQLCSLCVFSLL